ncbi:cytochrome P450 [Mycena capillaripes]|nr:cytochrome P450 [Mycena capillaripes]
MRPPGPPMWSVIGNLLRFRKDQEWKTYAQWAKKYGSNTPWDCVYFQVLRQPIIILDSLAAARDLLSTIYSSRPRLVMAGELVGFSQSIPLMPYTPRFLTLRCLIHKELTGTGLQKYWPLHEDESRILTEKILLDPDRFLDHIRQFVFLHNNYWGSVILRVTYGYQTAPHDDKFLFLAERVIALFSQAAQPGAWAVDILPWLRSLPSWLPGTGFKSKAAIWYQMHMDVVSGPFHWAIQNKNSPDLVQPNYLSTILAQSADELSEEDTDLLLWASASLVGDRCGAVHIFLAMALYPDIQATARAEIDKVLNDGRMPQLSDRCSLPYLECVMREVLRWNPIALLGGLPHLLIKDDIYGDYHISAGSIVMVNVWSATLSSRMTFRSILRDPGVFPNSEEFQPARFLNNERAVEVASCIFGFGRRACPGAYFAEALMFIPIATVLSQCQISDPIDLHGPKISKDVELRNCTVLKPTQFRCTITARGKD